MAGLGIWLEIMHRGVAVVLALVEVDMSIWQETALADVVEVAAPGLVLNVESRDTWQGSVLKVVEAVVMVVLGGLETEVEAATTVGSLGILLEIALIKNSNQVYSATFTLVNQCSYTVWPGILSGAGTPPLSTTGFALQPGQSNPISVPTSWSGRLWGRTLCAQDSAGKFTGVTGDCGSGTVDCAGAGGVPPASLAEFTLNGADGMDFYDVSLVDGYNLPMLVVPHGGSGGNCTATGCVADLNGACPSELKVTSIADGGGSVACKSACGAFGDPKYCCSGAYATPDTCKPTKYSEYFKNACPRAYSYAYDDGTSTFTCDSADYIITFCPTPSASKKSSGGGDVAMASSGYNLRCTPLQFITGFIIILTDNWRLWLLN